MPAVTVKAAVMMPVLTGVKQAQRRHEMVPVLLIRLQWAERQQFADTASRVQARPHRRDVSVTQSFITIFSKLVRKQLDPAQALNSSLAKIDFKIILPFIPRHYKCSLPLRYSNQNSVCISHFIHIYEYFMFLQSHPSISDRLIFQLQSVIHFFHFNHVHFMSLQPHFSLLIG
jgi:hypothetical protein